MTEPARDPFLPEDEIELVNDGEIPPSSGGCRRAGCGFLIGVVGSALITVAVIATLLTRGHPLSFVAQLIGSDQVKPSATPQSVASTPTPVTSMETAAGMSRSKAAETASPIPTPTFISVPTAIPTRTPTPTLTPTPTPIIALRQVNQLGRFESMQFVIQTVVDLGREPNNLWERICGSDKLLLVAGGEVVAGFDFSKVAPGDLEVSGRSLRLVLPPAEVFSYFVKEDETYVYLRNTGLLCRPDENLETQARRQAEQRLLDYAMAQGILARAEKAGLTQLEAFFRDLGFEEVELVVKPGIPAD